MSLLFNGYSSHFCYFSQNHTKKTPGQCQKFAKISSATSKIHELKHGLTLYFKCKRCCFYHKVVNLFYMSIYNLRPSCLDTVKLYMYVLYCGSFSLDLDSLLYTCWFIPSPPSPSPFDCAILQVIVPLRASLKQLIISVVVIIHQNSPILNWPQIVTSNDLLKCCFYLATLFRAQAVKKFAHRFLTISCSGGSMVHDFFHLVNLKLVSRPMWISNCKKICCQKLFNMDKTYDFVMKPLKIWSLGNVVSGYFSRNCNSHNQNSQFKNFEKFCR